jgi:hypothetical protein
MAGDKLTLEPPPPEPPEPVPSVPSLLSDISAEGARKPQLDDATIQEVVEPFIDTVPQNMGPVIDEAEQLQRWLAFLEPRFRCERRHSSTHASWVFQGTDLKLNTRVAIKLLKDPRPEARNAFSAEALLLSQLEHPGIVRYLAHGDLAEGGAYLVTEWLEGEDLGARVKRSRLSSGDAITLVVRAANVLAAAHARGVIHLDIKPSNLFLVGGDLSNIRLLDFGIAHLTRSVTSDRDKDSLAGTPGYMAPEQVLGEAPTPATDVFALGALLYRCLAGRRIFEGSPFELMTQTVHGSPARLGLVAPSVHPALEELVTSLLSMSPERRPADATAVLAAIAALPAEVLEGVASSARALLSPSGLTSAERVPTSVVLVRHATEDRDAMRRAGSEGRGRYTSYFEPLGDGDWLALPRGQATPFDQAVHAARLTLDVRAHWPRAAIAVVAGRTIDGASAPRLRELLAEAERRLESAEPGQIVLDASSAALVSAKFELGQSEGAAPILLGERAAAPSEEQTPARSLYVGREAELASLLAIAREAFRAPKARVVLLTGLAGIGKSSLVRELLERLREVDAKPTIWSAYADPMSAGSALRLVSALLDSAPAEDGGALARLLAPDAEGSTLHTAEVRLAGSVEAVHRAFCDMLDAQLRRGPLILRLEDVHWADLGSLRAIDHLLAALPDRPLLVLATGRPEVRELYPDLWQKRALQELRLSELSDADAACVVASRLEREPSDPLCARIVQRARGNAFLLEELTRAQVDGRGDELAETTLGVVQSRLRVLQPDARRVLRAASILGDPFTPRAVAFLLGDGSSENDVERWASLLVAHEVLRRRRDGLGGKPSLAFAHAVLRDAAYDLLTESDRKLGHRLAAQWLESNERHDATITAQHFARAGDREGAGRWYFRATLEAFQIGDFGATTGSAEHALSFELSVAERGHALAIAAHAHRLIGNVERSKQLSAEALRTLPPNSPLWRQAARTAMMAGASTGRHRDG